MQSLQQFMAQPDQWLHLPWHLGNDKPIILLTIALQQEPSFMRKLLLSLSMPLITRRAVLLHSHLKSRRELRKWDRALNGNIMTVRDTKGIDRYVFTEHGPLTLGDIRNIVTYYHLQPMKTTQNTEAFSKFLIDSLTPHIKAEMNTCMSKWKIRSVCNWAL